LALAFAVPAFAEQPKLIVAIAVDQFSSDLFNEYRATYTGGLKRLSGGVVFPRGHQSHAATETCPGHSTILTGSRPARSGIVANDWLDPAHPRFGKDGKPVYDVYCAEDPRIPGTSISNYVVSSTHLKVPTLGDRLKSASRVSRVLSVSGKDRAAVMMGGHSADLTLWWDGKAFVTYKDKAASVPSSLAPVNLRATAAIAKPVTRKLPSQCVSHSRDVPVSSTASVGTLKPRVPGNERAWRATPEFDAMTLDAALAAAQSMKLGQGADTDVLAISFSATDYVGHGFGTRGAEMCAQIVALDATLARLFTALDKGKMAYTVVLTADHGGHDLPERNQQNALPAAQRVDLGLSARAIGTKISKQFGIAEPALIGRAFAGDMYLAPSLPAEKRVAVLEASVAAFKAHPQVAAVYTAAEIVAAPAPQNPVDEWSLLERAKASYNADHSGDFIVFLKEFVTPIPDSSFGYVATHGSPWGYDRRVPILFWSKGMPPFEQPNAVETVDILPTLASLIALPIPAGEIDGRCLDLIAGPQTNCP
jgi:predicted AlkP superfamily pyrophosphatase or phosphodiesterase